ncbi:MAG: PIN domain-containing protein [Myxococcaceae bacterium]|nr:PIN domain-containing protein [Myxococcaceae bacterium]
MDRTFLDTNVLLYADDASAGAKTTRARDGVAELAASGRAVVSTQVLQEFFVIATKKLRLPAAVARQRVETFAALEVVLIQTDLILGAIDLHRLHSLSFWDALIIRAASAAGCTRLWSEDLQHGRTLEGVRIENPFLTQP